MNAHRIRKLSGAVLAISGLALLVFLVDGASADHDEYSYKFPCNPADTCHVTQLHHNTNAFDFDPKGGCYLPDGEPDPACLGDIRVVSEGIFRGYVSDDDTCSGSGLGLWAKIDDIFGRTMRYAHLSQFGNLQLNQPVYQGDLVGVEGNTGNSYDCEPHLHLEQISQVGYINGLLRSSLSLGPYTSTNSWVNAPGAMSQAIRQKFTDLGLYIGSSWLTLGWTADLSENPPHEDCGSFYQCQLFIHGVPDPEDGNWGLMIDFRRHPLTIEFENVFRPFDENAIMSGKWAQNDAYWIEPDFYYAWKEGTEAAAPGEPPWAEGSKIGVPLDDQIGPNPILCAASQGCVAYQRFSHGYIWEHQSSGVQHAGLCPDVNAPAWPDHYVDLLYDILGVINHINDPLLYDPQYDLNGDGVIDLLVDLLGTIDHYGYRCWPGGHP